MAVDAAYHRRWRAANKEKCAAATRRWKAKHGAEAVALASNYKLTLEDAQALLAARPDSCAICEREAKLYYDHAHDTGTHRGWLCNRCNVALNLVEQPELLQAALEYLGADSG